MKMVINEHNKELCEKYPFLYPDHLRDPETELINDDQYDYVYTKLDMMPDGWRIAFGEQLCEELKQALLEEGGHKMLDEYRVIDIKEKFGALRWYDNGNTEKGYGIIEKYEELSKRICVHCGRPATKISTGWISPWCDDCANLIHDTVIPLEDWFSRAKKKTEVDVDG